MARYIDADALDERKFPSHSVVNCYAKGWNDAIKAVQENAPTIEARPAVRGGWIEKQEPIPWCEDDVNVFWECSVCASPNYGASPFCPNCGADMRGAG